MEPDRSLVIIECAGNGATSKTRNPNVPRTPAEIHSDVLACLDAGAGIIHAHNADFSLKGRGAADDYLAAWRPILDERPGTIWYSTGVASSKIDQRLAHLEILADELGPAMPMMYVDPGSTNVAWIGDDGLPIGYSYV